MKAGAYTMPQFLPGELQELISRMLTVNPEERITIEEVRRHPWCLHGCEDEELDDTMHLNMEVRPVHAFLGSRAAHAVPRCLC